MAARRQAQLKSVFVDSSVLFTAVNSVTGGSAKLFTLETYRLQTSPVILAEVERNVRQKLRPYHLDRFFLLVSKLEVLSQRPNNKLIAKAKKAIVEKDAVILAEAKEAKANYLVTLDRRHFFTPAAGRFLQPKKIVTPKELLGS